ncbi:uncharacterized protein LOC117886225 isoform X1 [Trachemys scripta elegans]|uniref:uncharacterized protein LOC117886225 isoform X1 n=2 Tax=Trachemys scripta elegans TaxID=31138 RepID=UPI0015560582|nr:uncharacterized protein LOC117886225 isoform X1 [Trachemys scripta elegans]
MRAMSSKNSAWCDVANESDFYSCSWEASFSHSHCSCKDLTGSDSESDRHSYIDTNDQYHSLGEERERSQTTNDLTEAFLVSGNNQTNKKNNGRDYLLLQGKKSQYSRSSQKEKAPKSIPPSTFNRSQTIDHPSASCSARVLQSRSALSSRKDLLSQSDRPQLFITEQPVQEPAVFTIKKAYIVNKLHQKHPPADSPPTSKCNKAVQASFTCRGEDPGECIVCECSKRSLLKEQRNRKLDKKKAAVFHNTESIANQDLSSGELVNGHLHCPLEAVTDIPVKPQTSKHWCLPISSSTLVISLALEAGYSVPSVSLAGAETKYSSSSKVRKVRGDASRPALAFKLREPELNQYFNKLRISIVPNPVHLDTDTRKQAIPFTGQVGLQQIPGPEANQPLETQTDSSDSDIPGAQIEQASSIFKPPSAKQFFVSSEDTQDTVWPSTSYSVKKIPYRKGISIKEPFEEQKHQLKVCRSIRHPIVSTKPKEAQRDQRFINKPYISSNLDNTKTLDIEPFKQKSGHYKTVKETEIGKLNYVPLSETVKCHCGPLSNLSVNLYPKRRYSGIEKSLSINRKPSKRGGVTRRISAQSLLSDRDSTEETQYISPSKRKKDLKMQSILNFCFGWPGAQKKHERSPCKGEISSTAYDPETKEEGLLSPPLPAERRSLTAPFLQDERESQSLADGTFHPEDNLNTLDSPYTGNISNLVQPLEQRSMFQATNNVPLEKLDSESAPVPSGDSILKKLMFCRCGQMPQHGLFPTGDIFQSVTKKTISRPATGMGPCKPEPARECCHREIPDNMNETYWYSNQSVFPTHSSLENIRKQEATRGQFTNTQSYFENSVPAKTVTNELLKEGKRMEMGESGNIRSNMEVDAMHQVCAHGMYAATPSEHGGREKTLPEYSIYHPNYCPSCQPAATQKLGTSNDYYNCFKSKQKEPKSSLSIERGFTVDPCLGNRSQCKCSQEIPLPYLEQSIPYEENRATLPKRNDPDLIQDFSQNHCGWKRPAERAGCLGRQSSVWPAGGRGAE